MKLNFALDHLALAIQDALHLRRHWSSLNAVFRAMPREPIRFGAANHVLAGQARNVRTRSANVFALHNSRSVARLCRVPCQVLSRLSASDNKDLVAFYARHRSPPCISNGDAAAVDGEFWPINQTRTIRRQENNRLRKVGCCRATNGQADA